MEMEKLKGSERSVCAGITARFITARDGQIRHKTGKNPRSVFLEPPAAERRTGVGVQVGTRTVPFSLTGHQPGFHWSRVWLAAPMLSLLLNRLVIYAVAKAQ